MFEIIILIILGYFIYEFFYFRGKDFRSIRESVQAFVQDCNALNEHIEELKRSYLRMYKTEYGRATYVDRSVFHYQRPELKKFSSSQFVYDCSLSVCRNAQNQPFKYLCKYFNIRADEDTLAHFEKVLNDFSAVEEGKLLLRAKRDEIVGNIKVQIPFLIRTFRKNTLMKKLGFQEIDFSQVYFPKYTFRYISAGGNSSMHCEVVFNIENLEKFIHYLADIIKFRKSVAGQRALMTPALRERIKKRDNYTCQKCGVSIAQEPHLLLEIDHKKSLANGGLSVEENLQTLCWKCNRKKGANSE